MKQETINRTNEAAFTLVSAAEDGQLKDWQKQNAIAFLRAITAEYGDLADPQWKERADKLEGGK
jgi:hypothetical protein